MIGSVSLPRSLDELWECMDKAPDALLYAGGTDLLVRLSKGQGQVSSLICIERLDDLKGVRDYGDRVFIGACTTHARLLGDSIIQQEFPVLVQALKVLGSPLIRNMGTIGGNIMTASPAGDTLPPLYVLKAEFELTKGTGSRRMPIHAFIKGPGATAIEKGEVLSGIWLPKEGPFSHQHYEKVGQRKALAIAVVSLAAVLRLPDRGTIMEARLAWGSVGSTVVTSWEVEEFLRGKPLGPEVLEAAGLLAQKAVMPIDDIRASADYRRRVSGNLLMRLLTYGVQTPM